VGEVAEMYPRYSPEGSTWFHHNTHKFVLGLNTTLGRKTVPGGRVVQSSAYPSKFQDPELRSVLV
jgi:hypothetical protein